MEGTASVQCLVITEAGLGVGQPIQRLETAIVQQVISMQQTATKMASIQLRMSVAILAWDPVSRRGMVWPGTNSVEELRWGWVNLPC